MLIQFQNMRGRPTLGGTSDQPSALRGGAISPRNSNSSYREPDAACRGRIAFGVFGFILGFMFILPLILAGIAVKFG
jgi:hypothetical protein